jgi:hypothetical protein
LKLCQQNLAISSPLLSRISFWACSPTLQPPFSLSIVKILVTPLVPRIPWIPWVPWVF